MRDFLKIVFCFLMLCTTGFAQPFGGMNGGNRMSGGKGMAAMSIGRFYGKLVDAKTNKPIEAVTVQLKGNKFDSATKKMKEVVLKTVISESNGDFMLEGVMIFGNFKLLATAIGYKNLQQNVSFDIKLPTNGMPDAATIQTIMAKADKDLGNIKLEPNPNDLAAVTVSSTKAQFELGVDRKIFNVDKNIASTGQTAAELMKNIPSLMVDFEGNVSLRNASPTIFVDGRPTTLTLEQIPSDIIDKVELITNPGAKYDASGGGAGILNIVLKKNKKTGYNGGIRGGIDSRYKPNIGIDYNVRKGKINSFFSGMYNERKSIAENKTNRNNLFSPYSSINNITEAINSGYFAMLRGGIDYFIDNRNTITIAATFNRGKFNSNQDQNIDSVTNNNILSNSLVSSAGGFNFKNLGGQLSFKHNFQKTNHSIAADINYSNATNSSLSNLTSNTFYAGTTNPKQPTRLQRTQGKGSNEFATAQIDYENPLTEHTKFEAGARAAVRNFVNNNEQLIFNSSLNDYVRIPAVSNNFKFTDAVYALYSTYSFKVGSISYQLGLRAESSKYTGTLLSQSTGADSLSFNVDYPISLFPSVFITKKIGGSQDVQFNYSRKVNRPNFFQLMPYPDYGDPQNITIGNPALKPEFTHNFEVSYNNAYTKGSNFLANVYFKQTDNLIASYIKRDRNEITKGDSAYFQTFINANQSTVYGLELTNKMNFTTWWENTTNLNVFNASIKDNTLGQNNNLTSWFAKMNNSFKLPKSWSVQLSFDYFAKTVVPQNSKGSGGGGGGGRMMMFGAVQSGSQGYIDPRFATDFAIKKDWSLKNGQSLSFTASVNDIFRTQLYSSYSQQAGLFTQTTERRRDPQVLKLNISYRFGKLDTSLFKRKNTKAEAGGMDMM